MLKKGYLASNLIFVSTKHSQKIINSYTNNTDKIIYIFLISDSCEQFTIPQNIRLYRTSLYKSKQKKKSKKARHAKVGGESSNIFSENIDLINLKERL